MQKFGGEPSKTKMSLFESTGHLDTQEFPDVLWNKVHYPRSQEPATGPYPVLDEFSPYNPNLFPQDLF
jgi:hypothetical protein